MNSNNQNFNQIPPQNFPRQGNSRPSPNTGNPGYPYPPNFPQSAAMPQGSRVQQNIPGMPQNNINQSQNVPGQTNYPPRQEPTEPAKPQKEEPVKKSSGNGLPFGEILSRIFVGMLTVFIVVYMGWLFAPKIRNSMTFWPTNTPTPAPPTATVPATPTVTPLATNTPTASPTPTPGPISTYWIADGSKLDPEVPNAPEGLVILTAKNSAEVDPPLDSIYWTSSSQIVQDLGNMNSLYDSEWFATMNGGSIRWFMDQSLKEGLYEIYVMDTYYSSGGSLDFLVQLGGQTLTPLTSGTTVTFMTSQYDPRQNMDTWRSLGIYYIMQSRDILSVSTIWGLRDQYTYVAADRVMIVPRKMTDLSLLNALPNNGTRYIMDDTQATISAGNSRFKEDNSTSWDDSYQLIINPKSKCTVEYSSKEPWPIGVYSIYLYIPESKGGLDAEIEVRTDNTLLETIGGESVVRMHIPSGGSWVLVGQYNTDRYYERPVKFKVNITIPENQSGEYPVDAIAFIHQPFSELSY